MSRKLLRQLGNCDIERAACRLVRAFQGKLIREGLAESLNLFGNIPCPETATNLCYDLPEGLVIMLGTNDTLSRIIPRESWGPRLREEEEWIGVFKENLRRVGLIHEYLRNETTQGTALIGFHGTPDQQVLLERLRRIGMTRFPLTDKRHWLRRIITQKLSAFRVVNDLVCIHGVYDGHEVFWNGLGAEEHPQWHLKSEIQYDLGGSTSAFAKFLRSLTGPRAQ